MEGMRHVRNELLSEINVTPFVDVMLVLLIIFMVTAPMMMRGEDVDLPQTASEQIPAKTERLIITINRKGEIFLNDYKTTLATLTGRLRAIQQSKRQEGVFLQADEKLPYGLVVKVMAAEKGAGIKKLGMVTKPLEAGK